MKIDLKMIATGLGAGLAFVAMKKYGGKTSDAVMASVVGAGAIVGNVAGAKYQESQAEGNINSQIKALINN